MTGIDRRRMVLGSALLGTAALAALLRPARGGAALSADALDRAIPRAIPGYRTIDTSGVILPPEDSLSALLYDGIVVRSYTAPDGTPLSLVVAYGATQDYALQLHRPENCYPASGFRIGPVEPVTLALGGRRISASHLLAAKGERRERLLYWTRIGTGFPVTLWQEREAIVAAALRRRPADGVLVRLSAPQGAAAAATLEAFAQALAAALPPAGRALLLGERPA